MSIDASGSWTYPNAAINKTRLDQQSEDPIDFPRSSSFTQVVLYWDAVLPTPATWSEIIVGGQTQEKSAPSLPGDQASGEQISSQCWANYD
jgi:hypothetical protein